MYLVAMLLSLPRPQIQLLDELETFPIALNEALFEGYKCPSKVETLKIVLGGLLHL